MNKIKNLKLNYKLIIYLAIICIFSLITLFNINPVLPYPGHYGRNQLIGMILGFIGLIIIFNINLPQSKKIIDIVYFILVIMLLILAVNPPIIGDIFVVNTNGANGWFKLGLNSLSFQPVEFFKIAMIIKLAQISKDHQEGHYKDRNLIKNYLVYGILPIILVLKEPDLGGTILLLFPLLIMLVFSLKDKSFILKIIPPFIITVITGFLLIATKLGQEILIKTKLMQSYQLTRFDAWLNPFTVDTGYQLQQSLIFIGSAGPWGYGAGYDKITFPEAQTDLIFPVFVGFYGWIPGIILILLYFLIIFEFLKTYKRQVNIQYQFICIGFAALFFLQVGENIGMLIGLLPITGIVLPFMSYGMSAMITFFAIIGLILNINRNS